MGGERSSRHGQGRERRSSSFFSIFNVFKSSRGMRSGGDEGEEDMWDEAVNVRRVRTSDEDKDCWVAEPDIDRKASAFIARFYECRVSNSEIQTISPYDLANDAHH
ncbi:uncharacterized protein LOC122088304 [Macadamia integrifolia]|uniref:uncharacterized protein LOC122088304 n=1 Tax=Macadamia integrifolia TaxID=60698 RepID=UPI001C502034|nr:uncharacterized protein LOC122088304 [Macadamia integrifolia]